MSDQKLRHTVEEYRAAFSAIPEEDRKRIIGREWGNVGHGEDRDALRFADFFTDESDRIYDCCPLGAIVVAKVIDERPDDVKTMVWDGLIMSNPRARYVNQNFAGGDIDVVLDEGIVADFIRDWDEWVMTTEEMEAIFA